MEEKTTYEGHAIVELMGRNVIAGYVSEQTIAGVAMLRIDVPAVGEIEKYTKFVSGNAVYGITPTTQEIAERAAARLQVRPVSLYVVPVPAPHPALVDSTAQDGGDDGDRNDGDWDDGDGELDELQRAW